MKPKNDRNGEIHPSTPRGGRDYVELWITLARREWGSLVVVPADRGGSTAEIANALADIGQRLSYGPVTAITVSSLEYGSALALADLQQHLERERRNPGSTVISGTAEGQPAPGDFAPEAGGASAETGGTTPDHARGAPAARAAEGAELPGEAPADGAPTTQALAVLPPARLIISIPPVVTEPLGLAAAQEADAVVLAVRLNRSRMAEVRRTIELVGRDRVAGCFIVR